MYVSCNGVSAARDGRSRISPIGYFRPDSNDAKQLLAQLQAAAPGYKSAELLDRIEKEHGRRFMKTIRDQLIEIENKSAVTRK